jgi:hypothetical protein
MLAAAMAIATPAIDILLSTALSESMQRELTEV